MRNLKKILALVLALVMSFSLVATANAAFPDDASIDDKYDEAVEVLNGLKVFKGRPDGNFDPKANITRQEVAAIIYRIATGDTDDSDINLYVEGADFDDVKAADWAAGYIGYCNNAGYIAGRGNGKFDPLGNITGMEAAAMILRAVGYDAKDEFTGPTWDKYVAMYAQQLGLFANIKNDVNLYKPVTREVVAEILFRALQADQVEWTPAFEYQPITFNTSATTEYKGTLSLGEEKFGLERRPATGYDTVDNWGRPGWYWWATKVNTTKAIATIKEDPTVTYTKAVKECDVAHDTKVDANKNYALYVNSKTALPAPELIQALDTQQTIGATGRLTEVYKDADRIVMIDTYLAKVVSAANRIYDANGHLWQGARITLDVYNVDHEGSILVTLTDRTADYPYAAGDMVLVNLYTANDTVTAMDAGTTVAGNTRISAGAVVTETAGATAGDANFTKGGRSDAVLAVTTTRPQYGEIKGKAESFEGAQTILWWSEGQHTVNGTDYPDNHQFHLDQALRQTTNHTWYKDQYGYLIGAVDPTASYSYGVITSLWWADDATTGGGKAMANVTYMDGTTNTIHLNQVTVDNDTANAADNLAPVTWTTATTTYTPAAAAGADMTIVAGTPNYLYVANYDSTNARADQAKTATNVDQVHDIIAGHLFRFSTNTNGSVNAVEIAGGGNANTAALNLKSDHNDVQAVTKGVARNGNLLIDSETKFLIRALNAAGTGFVYTTATGFNNIDTYAAAEVDWVNLDGDDAAEYVYIIGAKTNATTSGLFFLQSNTVKEYVEGTTVDYYALYGYADGELKEIKIKPAQAALIGNLVPGWTVANSHAFVVNPANALNNRMFMLEYTDGYVSKVVDLETTAYAPYELADNKPVQVNNGGFTYDVTTSSNIEAYTAGHANPAYENVSVAYHTGGATLGTVSETWIGDVYTADGVSYNVTGITPVNGGTWSADMSFKNVHLVYYTRTNPATGQTENIVTSAYVVDVPSVPTNLASYVINTTAAGSTPVVLPTVTIAGGNLSISDMFLHDNSIAVAADVKATNVKFTYQIATFSNATGTWNTVVDTKETTATNVDVNAGTDLGTAGTVVVGYTAGITCDVTVTVTCDQGTWTFGPVRVLTT